MEEEGLLEDFDSALGWSALRLRPFSLLIIKNEFIRLGNV